MSRTIEVPDDVYARIEEAASTSGHSVAEVIASRFPAPARQPCSPASANGVDEQAITGAEDPPRTLADEFTGLTGLISTGRGDLSERAGESFARGLRTKYEREQAEARSELPNHA